MYYLLLLVFFFITTFSSYKEEVMPKVPNTKEFLQKIQQLESSGGKDFEHPVITASNLQQGTRAIGRYGLMPNTVQELVNRRRLRGTVSPDMVELAQLPPEEMKAKLEANPDLEDQLAEDLAQHVIRRQKGDEDKAAYSWIQGHNLNPKDISPENLEESPYVQKYRKLKQLMTDEN